MGGCRQGWRPPFHVIPTWTTGPMRLLLLLAGVLALTACNQSDTAQEETGVGEELNVVTAQGNDVTAIDAATGDDANMAADVEYTDNEADESSNGADGNSAGNAA